jgi:mRNA deadenylase 3'-5' endonuclease subunit Ccr4
MNLAIHSPTEIPRLPIKRYHDSTNRYRYLQIKFMQIHESLDDNDHLPIIPNNTYSDKENMKTKRTSDI